MIHSTGGAWFDAATLDELVATIERIRANANEMPDTWQVCVGESLVAPDAPAPPEPIFAAVHRDRLLGLLGRFEALAAQAAARRKMDRPVLGD